MEDNENASSHVHQPLDAFKTPRSKTVGGNLDPFAALNTTAIRGTPFTTAQPSAHTDGSDSGDALSPNENGKTDSIDPPTPMAREKINADVKTGRHASFQGPLTEHRAVSPRHSNIPPVGMFNHQGLRGFDLGNDASEDRSPSFSPNDFSSPEATLASFASRPYTSLNRIRAAVASTIPLGSAQRIKLDQPRRTYADFNGPKRPYSQEYGASITSSVEHQSQSLVQWGANQPQFH